MVKGENHSLLPHGPPVSAASEVEAGPGHGAPVSLTDLDGDAVAHVGGVNMVLCLHDLDPGSRVNVLAPAHCHQSAHTLPHFGSPIKEVVPEHGGGPGVGQNVGVTPQDLVGRKGA